MNKFKSFMEKFKKNILIYLVVWIVVAILLIAPVTYTYTNSVLAHRSSWVLEFSEFFLDNLFSFPITKVFEETYINHFIRGIQVYSVIYWFIVFYAINKTLPKSAFDKIEHGSSDWCRPGEQYKVLSKKEGIILAKDNYLPVDKPGNVNVLIVGRFWCW